MTEQHTGIVLRAPSAHKSTVTLFDNRLGKIEAVSSLKQSLSHGSLLSYGVKKGTVRYFLYDQQLLDLPLELARENFMFFHHVLELCDYFLPWDMKIDELFTLVLFLYRHPESVRTQQSQKLFLVSFFKRVGLHSGQVDSNEEWITQCIQEHPQLLSLRTAGFLKMLEGYEELA